MSSEQTYGGRYAVLEPVGSGGMAEVYRGRDQLLGREIAVKVLAERFAQDRAFVERFRREAQSAANLNHPNIVSLYDYGADGNSYYIVMEFIDGRSLADILREERRVMPERAAEIAADVARALARAHAQGIVHRDIKPGNIMITSSGQTKVTDFGIARAMGGDGEATMTQTGMVIGTAAYLSPEQAQGSPVDARSDVYSLGVVLYEMLTGAQPFTGETPLAVAYKHVREEPPSLTTLNPDVPRELAAITSKALAKNPDNRYSSAGEMLEDIDRFLAGQTVLAPPMMRETMVAPATRTEILADDYEEEEPDARKSAAYVIGALLLLALFGLIAFLLWRSLAPGAEVEVPEVVGMQEDEARATLEDANLAVEVERRNNQAPLGEVFRQDPEAGDTAHEGDVVTIFVSRGPQQVVVPNVVGLTLDEAREELREAGLRVGEVTREPSDDADEDEVLRQSFPPGAEVERRTEIDLVVSEGAAPAPVPNVIGQTEEAARSTLESQGFEVRAERVQSNERAGTVVDQDPRGGEEHPRGTTVTIVVSEGPGPQPMPDLRGRDADDAETTLENDYGMRVTRRDETQACAFPPGRVCRQEPDPGTTVSPGDRATLYVQEGGARAPSGFVFAALAFLLLY